MKIVVMGFLFDSLVHLLASDAPRKRAALARLLGRGLGVAPRLLHQEEPHRAGVGLDIWHFPKVVGRDVGVTVTVGCDPGRELLLLTLADLSAPDPQAARMVALTRAVAAVHPARHELVPLPPGTLGRSAHDHALLAAAGPPLREPAQHERILGASLDLVVPVTAREAGWIREHGAERYLAIMQEQGVRPLADRAPGETALPL